VAAPRKYDKLTRVDIVFKKHGILFYKTTCTPCIEKKEEKRKEEKRREKKRKEKKRKEKKRRFIENHSEIHGRCLFPHSTAKTSIDRFDEPQIN